MKRVEDINSAGTNQEKVETNWEGVAAEADKISKRVGEEGQSEGVEAPNNEIDKTEASVMEPLEKGKSTSDVLEYLDKCYRDFESYGQEVTGKSVSEMNPNFVADQLYFKTAVNKLSGGEKSRDPSTISSSEVLQYCKDEIAGMESRLSEVGEGKEHKRIESEINNAKDRLGRLEKICKESEDRFAPKPESESSKKVEVDYSSKTASDLLGRLEKNHNNVESYLQEKSGKTIEEGASDYLEAESEIKEAMREIAGEGDDARDMGSISAEEVIQYFTNKLREANGRYNQINDETYNTRNSSGFFSRRFGAAGRKLKELEKEQAACYSRSMVAQKRIDLIKSLLNSAE